ncbi:MAG: ABC transporter permease [Anaerolineae bacterium]|nr:ABC transporter permease [Anaerolineae bacterium]
MEAKAVNSPVLNVRKYLPYLYQYGIYIVFMVMVVVFSFTNKHFLSIENALIILQQAAPMGIAVVGMTFVLILAGIDISVGQIMYLSAILVAIAMEAMKPSGFLGTPGSYAIIFAIAILTGLTIGTINGLVISRFKIVPFIATLATMGIARGIGLIASNSRVFFVEKLSPVSNGNINGFPVVVIILLVLAIVFDYVLRRTPYGRQLMAIGNDSAAAQKIGINVRRNVLIAYAICGTMAGIAGVLSAGQVANVAVYFADGNEFLVISAAVLGGTSLFGGKGSVFPGALIGIILVTTIVNGMTMMNASPYAYKIVRGAIIFLAVMVDSINFKGELR